jgi:RNA-directed DNA polymerase
MDQAWPSFDDVATAYKHCRLGKQASTHQTRFEANLGKNLLQLHQALLSEKYKPFPTICFVVTKPKPREIFAAHFRDRIVHHLVVNRLSPCWEKKFIYSSFACRKGKGTHGALRYLQTQVRRVSQGGLRPVYALQLDLASFFVTIHRPTLCQLLTKQIGNPLLHRLVETLYLHDARPSAILKGDSAFFTLSQKRNPGSPKVQSKGFRSETSSASLAQMCT